VPRHSLREALTIAQALTDNFAGHGTSPPQVAMALKVSPTSSAWRTLTGAAVAYGLTSGAYGSDKIGLQDLGRRATAPTEEGDDLKAKAEAALKPRVFSQFFIKYQRAKFPPDGIAKNVLQHEFGVPTDRLDEVLTILKDNGAYVGFIHQTKTGPFVLTDNLSPSPVMIPTNEEAGTTADEPKPLDHPSKQTPAPEAVPTSTPKKDSRTFKVFISHGRDMGIVEQVKDVLDLYDIEYEVAVEEETTAIPVPQKVLAAMRRSEAGVMIVSADDDDAAKHGTINNNVLIEIGAAFVLYDQKVVLLWDKRLKVPSNLQGLYRCEFEGGQLTFGAGTKLAKAIKGFRT
jgi:predicted nucleotide-binding protein